MTDSSVSVLCVFVQQSKRFPDARPVLLLVSRDVPQWAKEHIYTNITAELAGTHLYLLSYKY